MYKAEGNKFVLPTSQKVIDALGDVIAALEEVTSLTKIPAKKTEELLFRLNHMELNKELWLEGDDLVIFRFALNEGIKSYTETMRVDNNAVGEVLPLLQTALDIKQLITNYLLLKTD